MRYVILTGKSKRVTAWEIYYEIKGATDPIVSALILSDFKV